MCLFTQTPAKFRRYNPEVLFVCFPFSKMAAPDVNNVELGFVEKVESWKLLSHLFPSKVGGKPAWLSLKPLPERDDLKCRKCQKPSVFLAQIYSPESDDPSFHRTLFLFICKDPACCAHNSSDNIRVFRSQLARVNEFYSTIPPNYENFSWEASFPSAWDFQDLCEVCGCHAPNKCAKCRGAAYCSREHQIIGWKSGHKAQCATQNKPGKCRNVGAHKLRLF
jgi:pre-rRNA-processing protein TSR4